MRFVHLLEAVDIVLQRLRNLRLHLLRRSARIHRHHHSLTDGEEGELVFVHLRQRPDAEQRQAHEEEEHQSVVPHRSFYVITGHHYLLGLRIKDEG